MGAALDISGLSIAYEGLGAILAVPQLSMPAGASLGIAGPSGAGKSSLLHALAGIERPQAGAVGWAGVAIWGLPTAARDRWRRESLGLVFQEMHLVPGLGALDNVLLPALFDHVRVPARLRARGAALLDRLGVPPSRAAAVMSRGERQRTALARALLRGPGVLVADEPTASLDPAAADSVGALLAEEAAASGATLVVATHDPALLARMDHRMAVRSGRLEPA